MKTAISIPDKVFKEADRAAKRLGISRSELYARAVEEYVDRLRRTDVTKRVDEACADVDTRVDPALRRAQSQAVGSEDWS
jgi:metal-responsive CopG/Arc/MetJ family transcriptional regulator